MPRIEPIPFEQLSENSRRTYEAGAAAGAFTDVVPYRILAYATHDAAPDDGDRHPNYPHHLLPGKLLELIRVRSAQLGGCEPCMAAWKVDSGDQAESVACLINPALRGDLNERERLALEFLERLSADHHGIDDDFYRRLGENFTTAEIIELGQTCGTTMGMHRFLHTLRFYENEPPIIPYDPAQVGVSKAQREARQTQAA